MDDMRSAIRLVAPTRSTVLINGESGTGKELVARAIHEGSPRAGGPFIKVNCAAVPAGLLESELFGHERGAFTGAVGRGTGRFEQAHGGSLLLDEISEMDAALQPKLLRALQEREFYRVGGSRSVRVDVRVLATTNSDLRERVRQGAFRDDLYYRLAVVPLVVPPLRDRRDDILLLAAHFLGRFAAENNRGEVRLTPPASEHLVRHDWPGNVRELRNAVERAVILCPGAAIGPEHFILEPARSFHGAPIGDSLYERERSWILQVLKETGGNRTAAARRLEVSVRTIRNKLAAYERDETGVLDESVHRLRRA
jgi:two-component system, NtrC family, response regulator HydG